MPKKGKYRAGDIFPTKRWGDVEILEYNNWDNVIIEFKNTGYRNTVIMSTIKKGTCTDYSIDTTPEDMSKGTVYTTKNYGDIEVLRYYSWDKVDLIFKDTGNVRSARADDIRSGSVRDNGSNITRSLRDQYKGSRKTLDNGSVLTIVDFSHNGSSGNPYFKVHCSNCSQDTELHPEGFFTSVSNWNSGNTPCPCSKSYLWSKEQYKVLLSRKLKNTPWHFVSFEDQKVKNTMKIKVRCTKHNKDHTVNIGGVLSGTCPCKVCSVFKARRTKLDTYLSKNLLCTDMEEVFYILRFKGRGISFIKSGICKYEVNLHNSVSQRFRDSSYDDFEYEVLHVEKGKYSDIALIEINSQEFNQEHRFKSYKLKGFSGYSECFSKYFYDNITYELLEELEE